jgi:hypothetical protein
MPIKATTIHPKVASLALKEQSLVKINWDFVLKDPKFALQLAMFPQKGRTLLVEEGNCLSN